MRILADDEMLVEVGQTALRGPDGEPLEAVPMYIVVTKPAEDAGDPDGDAALNEISARLNAGLANVAEMLAKKFDTWHRRTYDRG